MEDKIMIFIYFTDGISIDRQYTEEELSDLYEQLTTYGLYISAYGQIHKVDNILIPDENVRLETLAEYFKNKPTKKQLVKKLTARKTRATKSKA
ncbi:hypothetical protein OYT88_12310 [Sporolactobacillus sp. CQH2019]|uniref:hypothetical protein n=1 Tax=Sporolactobacillus sp. CQH2019 TaxID=3023512 RepID=UPI002368BA63|nr:hypothetical protein [Sporolactobacillus sp. CQH2019]MDD9149324.1 hypothetical protein [Sporolactobacillus sp. CQH2019]